REEPHHRRALRRVGQLLRAATVRVRVALPAAPRPGRHDSDHHREAERLRRAAVAVGRIAKILALCLIALASAEVSLWVANAVVARVRVARHEPLFAPFHHPDAIVPHERLYRRPAFGFTEHDELSYRNARVLNPADIVALGDSQTYGLGVA